MELRDYIPGDEEKILALFKIVFKKEMSPEYWKWRFIKNPINSIQIKLMFDGDLLAGHYAVSPQQLIVEGKPCPAALSMTTMTHPDYSGRGIFTNLANELYKDYSSRGNLDIVYGFPNDNSHYAFVHKLSWVDVCTIATLSASNFRCIENHGTFQFSEFTSDHHNAYHSSVRNYAIHLERTAAWLNWRYFQNPSNSYVAYEVKQGNACSFIVGKLFVADNVCEIDICELVDENGKASELISALIGHFSEYKINKINTWIPEHDSRMKHLLAAGFHLSGQTTHFGYRTMNEKLRINKDKFYFSMGDSDVY